MIKTFLSHQKEKKNPGDNMTADLLISQLNFFIPGASKEQSNLWVCWLLLYSPGKRTLSTSAHNKHQHTGEQPHAQTHRAPSGVEFLILKYTAINQTPIPRAPACLSQWKAQASGTLIAIYRVSHARSRTSTERPLFCSSLFLSLTIHDHWIGNHRGCSLSTASLPPPGCHSRHTFPTNPCCNKNFSLHWS